MRLQADPRGVKTIRSILVSSLLGGLVYGVALVGLGYWIGLW